MTKQEFEAVVIATMDYVRRTYDVRSFPNSEIIRNIKIPNNLKID